MTGDAREKSQEFVREGRFPEGRPMCRKKVSQEAGRKKKCSRGSLRGRRGGGRANRNEDQNERKNRGGRSGVRLTGRGEFGLDAKRIKTSGLRGFGGESQKGVI